jgi:hypothetical protein
MINSKSFVIAVVLLAVRPAVAQEEGNTAADQSMKTMMELVQTVELYNGAVAAQERLHRKPPIQRWSNPIGISIPDATVFVWTKNERPFAAAQLFEYGEQGWLQEFQSLSTAPLSGTHKGKLFWDTNAGISWQRLMLEMQPPADSADRRLLQMRLIARQFTAAEKTDTDSPSSLRLLTTPLYRYSQVDEGVIDGALFSFAIGTDPSVLLLVEARQADQDPKGDAKSTDVAEWKIAFAPMTIFACEVEHKRNVVWSCPLRLPPHELQSTFMLLKYNTKSASE